MAKDFDRWNTQKKKIEGRSRLPLAHAGEVWWCSLGVNIGAETDGKNVYYERPCIVMKVYNRHTLILLPLTSKPKSDQFHHLINTAGKPAWVKLTQVRVASTKRLLRDIDTLGAFEFKRLRQAWLENL